MLSTIISMPIVVSDLAVRYVDVAATDKDAIVIYTRRLTDSGFGSTPQLMVRRVTLLR